MKIKQQLLLAAASGVLVLFSFPTLLFGWHAPEMGWLGWIALVPLILAVRKSSPRRAFTITFFSSLIWYGASLYWIYRAMHTFGGLSSLISVMALILLVVVVAAYISLAPMAARFVESRLRGEFIVLLPVFWTALEFCRNYMPANGFPWANLAMSQWRILPLIQIVDVVGIYGLMFLMVWVNVCLAEVVERLRGERISFFRLKMAVTAVLLAAALLYGLPRMHAIERAVASEPTVKVGLVQGNIPQERKWDESKAVENLNVMRKSTRSLRDAAVDLILWPESAFPWPISLETSEIDPRALGLDEHEFGAMPYLLIGVLSERPDGEFYNSAMLIDAQGNITGRYHKAHLVPFGEYVPYKKFLFFARKLTRPAGNFLAGESYEPLSFGEYKAGPLVCYEDVFPEISRKLVANGAEFLANLTNDAWYGVSSAAYQHLALSVFRAVENRRYMLRATNTGISAVITPVGSIPMESGLFESAMIVAPVGVSSEKSVYTRLGDWFAWACVAYSAFVLAMICFRKIRSRCRKTTGEIR